MLNHITFTHNWNNKLDCTAFTTLRLHNPKKYIIGEVKEIWISQPNKQWKQLFRAKIEDVKTFHLEKMNEYIARLDTGYSRAECINIIRKMYKQQNPKMDLILLVKQGNDLSTAQTIVQPRQDHQLFPGRRFRLD